MTTIKPEPFSRKLSSFAEIQSVEFSEVENILPPKDTSIKPTHRTFDDGFEYKRYENSQESETLNLATA